MDSKALKIQILVYKIFSDITLMHAVFVNQILCVRSMKKLKFNSNQHLVICDSDVSMDN